tara:strand:+ start:1232 stop:2026 length:795 start_codon:yes stop_codon:yes gene_type:complete
MPFIQNAWDAKARRNIEKVVMPNDINWEMCSRWWDYLLQLPYFENMIMDRPMSHEGYKHGIKVSSNFPADRVMLCLFLLRAPQFQTGIVRTWIHLLDKFDADKDVAFVTAFALNNKPYAATDLKLKEDPSQYIQRMYPYSDQESTIIYPEYFSLKGAKLLLNRLLCEDPDEVLYHGQQPYMNHNGAYERYSKRCKDALGRFFAKKPACSYSTGNIQCVIYNDIIIRDDESREAVRKHGSIISRPNSSWALNDNQMREILNLIAA